ELGVEHIPPAADHQVQAVLGVELPDEYALIRPCILWQGGPRSRCKGIFYLVDRLALVDYAVLAHDVRAQPVAQGDHNPVNPVTIAECHNLLPLLSPLFCYYPSPPAPSPTRGEGEDGSH